MDVEKLSLPQDALLKSFQKYHEFAWKEYMVIAQKLTELEYEVIAKTTKEMNHLLNSHKNIHTNDVLWGNFKIRIHNKTHMTIQNTLKIIKDNISNMQIKVTTQVPSIRQ